MALKDITLGQFFPGSSPIHNLDPRAKLVSMICYIVALFLGQWFVTYAVLFLVLAIVVAVSKVSVKSLLRGMKPVVFILVFTAVLNVFYTRMMSIALRFIPTLIEETDKIMSAQRARGADFDSGNLIQKAKALIPLLVPLFISAFRRADELATAMECRCYHGGEGRTRMKQLHYRPGDVLFMAGALILAVAVGVLGRFGL